MGKCLMMLNCRLLFLEHEKLEFYHSHKISQCTLLQHTTAMYCFQDFDVTMLSGGTKAKGKSLQVFGFYEHAYCFMSYEFINI